MQAVFADVSAGAPGIGIIGRSRPEHDQGHEGGHDPKIWTLAPCAALILRQPPARLLAMICLNMAVSARRLIFSPSLYATVRAVVLSCPAVMMPWGSGTMPPSYRN